MMNRVSTKKCIGSFRLSTSHNAWIGSFRIAVIKNKRSTDDSSSDSNTESSNESSSFESNDFQQ